MGLPVKRVLENPQDGPSSSKIQLDEAPESPLLKLDDLEEYLEWLERAVLLNRDHRTKFATEPEKFLESEANLDAELARLEFVGVDSGALAKLTGMSRFFHTVLPLLGHENSDIAGRVVELLGELLEMDEEITPEAYDSLFEFAETLFSNQLVELLLDLLAHLNAEQDSETEFKTLGLFEALMEIDSSLFSSISPETIHRLYVWLVNRYYDSDRSVEIQHYAAELTAMLIQLVPAFKSAFAGSAEAMDLTIAAIAAFKERDPSDADESEYLENLFDIACAAVLEPAGQLRFLEAEGMHLLVLLLSETNMVRVGAVKLLATVLATPEHSARASKDFVEVLGLRVIFPILMGKGQAHLAKHYKQFSLAEDEEHITSSIAILLQRLDGEALERVIRKLREADGEKTRRLTELHAKYQTKANYFAPTEEADEEILELERLEHGLFTLRQIDFILGTAFTRLSNLNSLWSSTLREEIRATLKGLAESSGPELAKMIEPLVACIESAQVSF